MRFLQFFALTAAIITTSGCATAPTWGNKGPGEFTTSKGRITCYTDANMIDGERMEGTLCATNESNFLGGGEPEIQFGPWNTRFIRALSSKTTAGINKDYNGKNIFLKCDPILTADLQKEIGRNCSVTVNNQNLVSAKINFGNQ